VATSEGGDKYAGDFKDGKFSYGELEFANGDRLESATYIAGVLAMGRKITQNETYDG